MKILFADTDFWSERAGLKKKFKTEITQGYKDAKKLLPIISDKLSFVVQSNPRASIPEVGSGARAQNSELIIISFDPSLPYGEKGLLKSLRPTVFHEMNHVARFTKPLWHKTFLDSCLMEGLATVFERERADAEPLWGDYPKNVEEWIEEVKNAKSSQSMQLLFRHPDGRRWVGYKVGTYIVDQAMEKSGKTIEELSLMECDEIFSLAGV